MPINFCNIVAVLDIGFSALNSIVFSWLPIGFLFGLIFLKGVDSFACGEIVKSVVIEASKTVNNVLFRSESCPVQVNGWNLPSLMNGDSGLSSSVSSSVLLWIEVVNFFGTATFWNIKKFYA